MSGLVRFPGEPWRGLDMRRREQLYTSEGTRCRKRRVAHAVVEGALEEHGLDDC